MSRNTIEAIYPLSPMQQGMLFDTLYNTSSKVCHTCLNCIICGELHIQAFRQAWQRIIQRHTILRTQFVWEDLEEPLQIVRKQVELCWTERDWRYLDEKKQQECVNHFIQSELTKGFDLTRTPLLRIALLRLSERTFHCLISVHHLLLDGWSLQLLLQELFAIYHAYSQNDTFDLPPSRPYKDYIMWLQQQDKKRAELFWRKLLEGFKTSNLLQTSTPETKGYDWRMTTKVSEQQLILSPEITATLKTLARQWRLTINTIVQGAWGILMSTYSGDEDIVFGSVVSGRPPELVGVETMIGMFINTLPVRLQVRQEMMLLPWLRELQNQQVEARQYEYTPLMQIKEWSNIPKDLPLLESIVLFEIDVANIAPLERRDLHIEFKQYAAQTNYPIYIEVGFAETGLSIKIVYDRNRFEETTVGRMLGHFQTLLEGIVADPTQPIGTLPLLTPAERQELLLTRNETHLDFPETSGFHQLFSEQAMRTPDAIAVEDAEGSLTYEQLERRSNQLARYLQEQGVGPEVRVALCLERSRQMLIALLAIFKAGGAFVPLDPQFPPERQAYMLTDAKVSLLLTQQGLVGRLPLQDLPDVRLLCLDSQWNFLAHLPDSIVESQATAENLAYIMYTSGSTGRPKGVLIPHRGLLNYLLWCAEAYGAAHGRGAPVQSSIAADAIFPSLFAPLLVGATVVFLPESSALESLKEVLQERGGLSLIKITPTQLEVLNQQIPADADATGWVRTLVVGAEALRGDILDFWQLHAPGTIILNEYGPTETVVGCSIYHVPTGQLINGPVPIGLPIANTQFYVLDAQMQLVPIGVVGELYIGGAGVAWGYLNQAKLTAERFVPDPFSAEPGARLYKTGDLVRYLPDRAGNIEFVGRADQQVKIRGYRVELGEIEATLAKHPSVRAVAVIVREDIPGDKHLVAYVVPHEKQMAEASLLRDYLKGLLPSYMIPTFFVPLENLPLTSNGKLDHHSLPRPSAGTRAQAGEARTNPRDVLELQLIQMWEEILSVRPIGITDNFFELGGNSISALRVMTRIQKQFGQDLPLALLFQAGTVQQLAETLRQKDIACSKSPLVAIKPQGSLRPFFCVHPALGNVLRYYDLAHHLSREQPFYGLQDPDVYGEVHMIPVEEMAKRYLEAIRTVQPEGPYLLGGFSFGGIVAFEIAQQLRRQATDVDLLAIFDSGAPSSSQSFGDDDDAAFLAVLAMQFIRGYTKKSLEDLYNDLGKLTLRDQLQYVLGQLDAARLEIPWRGVIWLQHELLMFKTRTQLVRMYNPPPYPGQITLFKSSQVDNVEHLAPVDKDWQQFSTEPLEIKVVPGFHDVLLIKPNVQILAEVLQRSLDKAQS